MPNTARKMLLFDFRPSENQFFEDNIIRNLEIKFFRESLNDSFIKNLSKKELEETEIISPFITSYIDENVLKNFKNLKLIATRSTGTNHIDLNACSKRNIIVANVKNYSSNAVAQYTLGLILALERNIFKAYEDMKKFTHENSKYIGRNLNNLTLGVIGTGEIGVSLSKIVNLIGMKILAYDIKPKYWLEQELNLNYVDFDTLIKKSDIITIHMPYREDNYHIFSDKQFSMMKKDAFFINTARGELVDIIALYKALVTGEIKGCALDVVECEKISFAPNNLLKNLSENSKNCAIRSLIIQKILNMPNVIVTPHIAYNTLDAVNEILKETMKNIRDFYKKIR